MTTFEVGILVARTAPARTVTLVAGVQGEGTPTVLTMPALVTVVAAGPAAGGLLTDRP